MRALFSLSLLFILLPAGCRTLAADQKREVFDQRVQERFPLGMSKEQAWDQLERLSIEPHDYGDNDENIICWVKPQRAVLFTGFFDYYYKKRMRLYFGDDNALDRITFEPIKEDSLYEIELVPAAPDP